MVLERPEVDRAALAARTGWEIKPEGACKADRCVPLPDAPADGPIDARMLSERLGMALVSDESHGLWALGPGVRTAGRCCRREMPDLELPDRNGRPFSLRSLRGTRFVMVAWASW